MVNIKNDDEYVPLKEYSRETKIPVPTLRYHCRKDKYGKFSRKISGQWEINRYQYGQIHAKASRETVEGTTPEERNENLRKLIGDLRRENYALRSRNEELREQIEELKDKWNTLAQRQVQATTDALDRIAEIFENASIRIVEKPRNRR